MEKKFSYNKAMEEVEQILDSLEQDKPDVDQMSVNVKRATSLLKNCKQKLYNIDTEIKKVFEDFQNDEAE